MNYLSVENLSKDYGERILFEGLTFGLSRGDKMALIANNGTGKSSLLKIIANEDIPDSGTVTLRTGIGIGNLAQEPNFDKNKTIEELISSSNSELIKTIKDYEKALEEQAKEYNSHTIKQLDEASAKMDEAFTNQDKELVLQMSVKHEQQLDCGGAYVKLMGDIDQSKFGGDTPYQVMFGPDICVSCLEL